MFRRLIKNIIKLAGFEIKRLEKRKNIYACLPAWDYQSIHVLPHYKNTDRVIDIGCGAAPSPLATVLTDFFPDDSIHRARPVVEDRPLIVCSVERMPIRDKFFDLSICSHVLEHVPRPGLAAQEIARVSKKGYLETPAYGKDILVGTGHQHIWQIVNDNGVFHFFPYTPRQHRAHNGSPVMSIWCQEEFHPWQSFFWERQDVFNAIQFWEEQPKICMHEGLIDSDVIEWKPVCREYLPNQAPALTTAEIVLLEACLISPRGESMTYREGEFTNPSGEVKYPVRGKRIYFELGAPYR
jgi:SAM-dependent methyltransferase